MARNHAQILTSIWTDEDFLALTPGAQRMYLMLLSQQNLSHAGLLPLTVKRWANKSRTTTVEQVEKWLAELTETRFVLIDHDTEELLVRSLIRRDEVYKQPQVMAAAAKDARAVASQFLALALAVEIDRIRLIEGLPDKSLRILDTLAEALPKSARTLPEACPDPEPQPRGRGMVTEVSTGSPSPTPTTTPTTSLPATRRADVERLCDLLVEHIVTNGSKRPTVTKGWHDAARLMLDRDGRPFDEAMSLLGWCQTDEFWRANVLSMPTFREKYDQIRLQRDRRPGGRSTGDERVRGWLELAERSATPPTAPKGITA